MPPTELLIDAEGAVRAWARAKSSITTLATGGVFFGIPVGASFPLLTIARVGGGPAHTEAPVDAALIQFDTWGTQTRPGIPDGKASAAALATAVVNACLAVRCGDVVGDTTALWVGEPAGPVWSPDPDSGRARYVLTVEFGLRGA